MPRNAEDPVVQNLCTRCLQPAEDLTTLARHGGSVVRQRLCPPCLAALAELMGAPSLRDRIALEKQLRQNYGIGTHDYEAQFVAQDGRCAICRVPGTDTRRLAVDHHHGTGIVRGLLCDKCNRNLGFYGDDPALLLRAAAYLAGALGNETRFGQRVSTNPQSPNTPNGAGTPRIATNPRTIRRQARRGF